MSQSQPRAKEPTPDPANTKSKSTRFLGKIAAFFISTVVCLSIFFGADFYLHYRHGVNLWGYRGPAAGLKQPDEKRIAILGGSTSWGYGLRSGQDFPAQLQRLLASGNAARAARIHVLNFGFNNEGAYSFAYTLNDYDYLKYDAVLFYSGYNDLGGPNLNVFRHRSPVFLWTGYLPLLPTLAADRLSQWQRTRSGKNDKIIFQPPDPDRPNQPPRPQTQFENLDGASSPAPQPAATACPAEWQFYCDHIYEATELALKKGKRVLIVGEPYITEKHAAQQTALENMVRARFANRPQVNYLNLGRVVDLRDPSLCWDGMHLTEEGNRRIAEALAKPVLELLKD